MLEVTTVADTDRKFIAEPNESFKCPNCIYCTEYSTQGYFSCSIGTNPVGCDKYVPKTLSKTGVRSAYACSWERIGELAEAMARMAKAGNGDEHTCEKWSEEIKYHCWIIEMMHAYDEPKK